MKEKVILWVHKILMPILLTIITISMGLFSWIGKTVVEEFKEWRVSTERRLVSLELTRATVEGNRFSSDDWTDAKIIIDKDRVHTNSRVTRLEERFISMSAGIARIEKNTEKINERLDE